MLNDEPVNPDGTEMRGYRETEDGYCVYTSLNKSSKETLERFAKECGLGVKFNW